MIERLQTIGLHHGFAVPVYFDCPKCQVSFTPDVAVTKPIIAVLVAAKGPDAKA
jgi:hypothetical protein